MAEIVSIAANAVTVIGGVYVAVRMAVRLWRMKRVAWLPRKTKGSR